MVRAFDLLALDEGGTLYVIELKRARTPREVVAQVLDYGAWARGVSAEGLARVFELRPFAHGRTFHSAFAEQFDGAPPETINHAHRLVIVASELDDSTERIVECLLEDYRVPAQGLPADGEVLAWAGGGRGRESGDRRDGVGAAP